MILIVMLIVEILILIAFGVIKLVSDKRRDNIYKEWGVIDGMTVGGWLKINNPPKE